HRLLDVLQRLAGEGGPRRVGVEEAGADADLEARHVRHCIAASKKRRNSAAVQGRGLVWWHTSAVAISTSRGRCAAVTPRVARPPVRPMSAFGACSHGTPPAPPPPVPPPCPSSSNLCGTASKFQASTVSIMSALARP